jgi:hypothetical protein
MIVKKIKELESVIEILTEKTKHELENFSTMLADDIMDAANEKDGLMREFIIVKSELDMMVNGLEMNEILKLESHFIDLEEKMMAFKIVNRRLLLLTVPIQEMYNDLNNKVRQTSTTKKNMLNTSI